MDLDFSSVKVNAPKAPPTTCQGCGKPFEAAYASARFCMSCRNKRKEAGRTNKEARRTDRHLRHAEFIAVDGEGLAGDPKHHPYVLLGVGVEQREWPNGVTDITEIFSFLWQEFEKHPKATFVGFFLRYDFNCWLRLLPRERADRLFHPELRARRNADPNPLPVAYRGWEFDILGMKRFKLRPYGAKTYMYINDAGSFFQQSLMKVLSSLSENSTITDEEIAIALEGKQKRASAVLDDDMRRYNRTENIILAKLMEELDQAFVQLEIPLSRSQYYGPGQAAQKWMLKFEGVKRSKEAVQALPEDLFLALQASYYGGIFEQCAHGKIPGRLYEYDINSAYPTNIANLPCMCGKWAHDKQDGIFTLVHAKITGTNDWFLGPMPWRDEKKRISRPKRTVGWYWMDEIDASTRAGLIEEVEVLESWTYYPCKHKKPLEPIRELYQTRLKMGKNTAFGKACKLVYNSAYGKSAQSIGNPKVSNVAWASRITSLCRIQILNAIATHPYGYEDLIMIATDAVFFRHKHPGLKLSNELGDWDLTVFKDLYIAMPGIYWSTETIDGMKEQLHIKSRGVPSRDFQECIKDFQAGFDSWPKAKHGEVIHMLWGMWVEVGLEISFAQVSIPQALMWTKTDEEFHEMLAGINSTPKYGGTLLPRRATSKPSTKRGSKALLMYHGTYRSRVHPNPDFVESIPYDKTFGVALNEKSIDNCTFDTPDGEIGFGGVLTIELV